MWLATLTATLLLGPGATASPPAPEQWRGRGMLISGGVLLGAAATARSIMSGLTLVQGRCRRADRDDCGGDATLAQFVMFTAEDGTTVPLLVGLGLVGGGLHRLGHWYARNRTRPDLARLQTLRRREVAGWSLLGAGMTVLAGSIAGSYVCMTKERFACSLALHEGGALAGLGMMAAGVALAPFAAGHRHGRREQSVFVAPQLGAGVVGLRVSGRF